MISADFLIELWDNRKMILGDPIKRAEELPECKSGGYPCGELHFPIGVLLKCWEESPSFRQQSADDHECYIFQFSGSMLSGRCDVKYIDMTDESIHEAPYQAVNGNRFFQQIYRAAQTYIE